METKLKTALGLSVMKKKGSKGGGCISEGNVYDTENGLIFVKTNQGTNARIMFEGEMEGLKAIQDTNTVRVPNPINVFNLNPSGSQNIAIVMEYLEMSSLSSESERLGEQLARMHLFNSRLKTSNNSVHEQADNKNTQYVHEFGFHVPTCCGAIPQDNTWKKDWLEFFAQQRIEHQIRLVEKEYSEREARELWSELSLKLPTFFKDMEIMPSLLHGDLWSGNAAQTQEGPVIFDPAVFYGHSEYDLSIAEMFGGFSRSFYNAYHNLIPKQPGFEMRRDLYKLFHCLNHWNHFGGGYRSSSVSIMKRLLKE